MIEATIERLQAAFEGALAEHLAAWRAWPPPLADSGRYVLSTGGKRVRPLLALLGAEAVEGAAEAALPWAVAVELVHTYSLVHDDLPCMDDDDVRRGQPTCHKQFGEAQAVLTGDALLTDAFGLVVRTPGPDARRVRLVALLAEAAGGAGMVGGQVVDVSGEPLVGADALEAMHRRKTGALIRAAVTGGAIAAGAGDEAVESLAAYGEALGLLFQITDDLLDRSQDAGAGNPSYFDHLDEAAVLARRDATAAAAREALAPLGPAAAPLAAFVERIASRTT